MPAASSEAKPSERPRSSLRADTPRQTMSMSGGAPRATNSDRTVETSAGSGKTGISQPPWSNRGKQPWWRAALASGCRCGQRHATQTGSGSCAGRGKKAALSTKKCLPCHRTSSPDQRCRKRSSESSRIGARSAVSAGSPRNELNSLQPSSPRPTPTTSRPFESRSSVAAWRATTQGRRRASGVTSNPRRILAVA